MSWYKNAAVKKVIAVIAIVAITGAAAFISNLHFRTDPIAEIVGPTVAKTGDLVVFAANEGNEKHHYSWMPVPSAQIQGIEDGKVLITVFQKAGKYIMVLGCTNGKEIALDTHTIIITKSDPGPDPDPDPDPEPDPDVLPNPDPTPTPGKKFAMVIHETGDITVDVAKTLHGLRKYLSQNGHSFRIEDKDLKDKNGNTPDWFQGYLDLKVKKNVALPAIFVGTLQGDGSSVGRLKVVSLPGSASEAIALVKEN